MGHVRQDGASRLGESIPPHDEGSGDLTLNAASLQKLRIGEVSAGNVAGKLQRAEAIPANTVVSFTVDLHQQGYTFRAGHRIMVQVQSRWFPLYDRNPQTFVPNILLARADDYTAQRHRVQRSAKYPSHVEIAVLP